MPIDPYAVLRALLLAEAARDGRAVLPARDTPDPEQQTDDKDQDTGPQDRA
ncbi:hypothetical protein ACWGDS_12015 [Streptomyces sp. NPDC055059]|jgi:hypothetical protein|uniref:Uncharacterized protein n=1 Tax=Streptomyces sp. NBC_00119 TaxID=2975659 RepID=A0AAU1UC24_9ACTN|nr:MULTISPECIES: hypothetical protein [unclassified Streptomyces]MCX4644497.1 hypothetical protein [Streptomyces sp. NBC_01446]MCX5325609.1 hypothetical protein [Streptomyces sp. NBC_00120]